MTNSSKDSKLGVVENNRATEKARGFRGSRWPVEKMIDQGAALATFYYGDVDPDFHDEFKNGLHQLTGPPAVDLSFKHRDEVLSLSLQSLIIIPVGADLLVGLASSA